MSPLLRPSPNASLLMFSHNHYSLINEIVIIDYFIIERRYEEGKEEGEEIKIVTSSVIPHVDQVACAKPDMRIMRPGPKLALDDATSGAIGTRVSLVHWYGKKIRDAKYEV